jgi:hypothetical protein
MSDDTVPDTAEPDVKGKGPRAMNAKGIRRRLDKINAGGAEGATKGRAKKQAKLAETILAQIASGEIRNPVAAARAFVEGTTAASAAPAAPDEA